MSSKPPLFVSIPHSGEMVPDFCDWLKNLPEEILMCDVDRYVDRLYLPTLQEMKIPTITTEWHRYAADLNRVPEDVDASSVEGSENPAGSHSRGFHWVITTLKYPLMKRPMTRKQHDQLVTLIYEPFHKKVREQFLDFETQGYKKIFHIDAHSMPSVGTSEHRDPGEKRADIVVSDCKGKSADKAFVDLVIKAYESAGFKVAYNWPYFGGRVSEQYGNPLKGHHTVQVEMNRALYMNETSKKYLSAEAAGVQLKIKNAMEKIELELRAF